MLPKGSPRKSAAEQRSEIKRSSFLPSKYQFSFIHLDKKPEHNNEGHTSTAYLTTLQEWSAVSIMHPAVNSGNVNVCFL